MAQTDDITDLTRGVYRRLYAGFVRGRRINSVSLAAEAWFWRINAVADDFGNLDGEPVLCHAATAGRRATEVSPGKVDALVKELVGADLLRRYAADGEDYLHVVGFNVRQPKSRNGKRVKRVPHSPWDDPNKEGGIQVNPGASSASHSDSHTHSDSDSDDNPATQGSDEPAARASSAAFLKFPTVAGRRTKVTEWVLTDAHAKELEETFSGVDVRAECRKALAWIRAKPGNKKTANGMPEFLFRWLTKEQNRFGRHTPNRNGQEADDRLDEPAEFDNDLRRVAFPKGGEP